MDSSNGSFDLAAEDVCETEMKFEQGKVSQKFIVNDKKKKEVLILGKLSISENKFGQFIEWHPTEERVPSPFATPTTSTRGIPLNSDKEWAMVHGTTQSIGFKAGKDAADKIEFVPDPRTTEYRRPVKFELTEIGSLLIPSKAKGRELIFILKDGTSHNAFIFERGSVENFTEAMERYVTITRTRERDLHLLSPKKVSRVSPPPSIAELFLPEQLQQFMGLIKDVRNDPMSVAKTGLAKLADYTATQLSGYAEQHGVGSSQNSSPRITTPSSPSSTRFPPTHQASNGDGTDADADYTTNEEGYEVIFKPEKSEIELPPRRKTFRGQPLSQEQWLNYLDNDGRVTNFEEIKQIVFRGGVESAIRKHVWIFLLGLHSPSTTYEERKENFKDKILSYETMKMQWSTITEDQEERFHAFRDYKSLIEKDVARTDRCLEFFSGEDNEWTEVLHRILMTYMMYNFNTGYVQGMSDILSPILMEVQDEVMAFWLFARFMDTIYKNFEMSQETMQQQLRDSYTLLQLVDPRFSAYLNACDAANMYFAFRWLLILYKREFSTSDILVLWEALWTQLPGPNFHLFLGLAILDQHKSTVMENKFGLSEILRHVNDLSMKIDLGDSLSLAEAMYLQLLEAQESLPNRIRVIMGLPEKEESSDDLSRSLTSSTPPEEPVINVRGQGPQSSDTILMSDSVMGSPSPSAPSPTVEEQSLELNCDLGISQFM